MTYETILAETRGKVGLISYQRPVPKVYFQGSAKPATAQPEIELFPKS